MPLYESAIPQLKKMLLNLDRWLKASVEYAKTKSFDPNVLLAARLAPDQYPLVRQVQAACDAAKFAGARLSGKEAPKHPDTETTMDELLARIAAAVSFLGTLRPADLAGGETRLIELPFLEGKVLSGGDYLAELVLPNFYFHATTAYAILRHNGVPLGKTDFIGSLNVQSR